MNATQPVLGSVLTCPRCGHRKQEVMLPMRASGSTNARAVTWSCGPRQAIAASFAHTARGSARLFKSLDKAAVRRDPRLPRARLRGRRLSFIRRCRDFGFTIEHVRELVGLVDLPSRDCVEVRDIAQAHLREVQKKLAELQALQASLSAFVCSCNTACAGGPAVDCTIL